MYGNILGNIIILDLPEYTLHLYYQILRKLTDMVRIFTGGLNIVISNNCFWKHLLCRLIWRY